MPEWEHRVEHMSDRELLTEVRYYNKPTYWNGKPVLRDVVELTPYQVLLETLLAGK
jgi:hypothetical protein